MFLGLQSMDAAVYWAYGDEGAIQDDKREVESVLAQKGNESRKAREKRGEVGDLSSTCWVAQEAFTTRELHLPEIGTSSVCGGFL